jgi:hypothetical protein
MSLALTLVLVGSAQQGLHWAGGFLAGNAALGQAQPIRPTTTAPILTTAPQAPQAPQLRPSMFGSTTAGSSSSAAQSMRATFGQVPGTSGRPGSAATDANGASLLGGNERFLRRNRRAGTFVGTDSSETKDFVGAQSVEGTQQVGPAVGNVVRGNAAPAGSDNAGGRTARAYPPRLAPGFDVPQAATISDSVLRQLRATPGLDPSNQIEVTLAGQTATLRGVVASARDRALIEQLLLFEPGISVVRNDLVVRRPGRASAEGERANPLPVPPPPRAEPTRSAPPK